jgi:hypothetical protein
MTLTTHRLQTGRGLLPALTLVALILLSGCQGNPTSKPGTSTASTGSGRPSPEAEPGLAVGSRASAFTLKDQTGAMKIAAPELQGIEAWINSKPLALKDLRGKVVVLHFWTFG